MSLEDEDSYERVSESSESSSESAVADLAHIGQEKPDDYKEKEEAHSEMRKLGKTPSSKDLPQVDWAYTDAGTLVIQFQDKLLLKQVADDDPVLARERATEKTADPPVKSGNDGSTDKGADKGSDKSATSPAGLPEGALLNKTGAKGESADTPAPPAHSDLNKDAADIRKATKKDDLIDLGTDEDAIYNAFKGKTPAEIEEMKKIYAKNNNGADLMADMKDELSESEYKKLEELMAPPKDRLEKTLAGLDKSNMSDAEKAEFRDNMKKFEERGKELEQQYKKEFEAKGMSPADAAKEAEKKAREQIDKTYANLERLLEKNDKAPVPEKDRILLAEQAMKHAANPKTIFQGEQGTCNVTTIETRTFTKDPAEATRLLTDVATTGKYTSNGNPPVTVEINADPSLQRQGQSKDGPGDGKRDYASQVFQVAATNVALEIQNQQTNPPGQLRYEQRPYQAGSGGDNGERVVDYSTKPPVERQGNPGMPPLDVANVAKHISPGNAEGAVIDNGKPNPVQVDKDIVDAKFVINNINGGKPVDLNDPQWAKKAHEQIDKKTDLSPKERSELKQAVNDLERHQKLEKESGVVHVNSEKELADTLSKLKKEGKLPVVVAVDTNHEPFWSDSHGGDAGGAGGAHAITITDFDEKTGKAKIQNQWGEYSNHDISTRDLYNATKLPKDSIEDLQKETADARKNNNPEFLKEYELLRLQKQQGKISDADYDKKLVEITLDRVKFNKAHGIDTTKDPASKEVQLMLEKLKEGTPAEQERAKKIAEAVSKGMKEINAGKDQPPSPKAGAPAGSVSEGARLSDSGAKLGAPTSLDAGSVGSAPKESASARTADASSGDAKPAAANVLAANLDAPTGKAPDATAGDADRSFLDRAKDTLSGLGKGIDSSLVTNDVTQVKSPDGSTVLGVGDVKVFQPAHEADEVYSSLHIWNEPDRLKKALSGRSPEELRMMDEAFKKEHGMTMKEYVLKETKEGSQEQKDALELLKPMEKPEAKDSKEKVEQLAEKIKDGKEKEQFKKDIQEFETRKPPVSPEEREKFYKEVAKLMEASDNPKVKDLPNAEQRVKIAQQIMHNAAHPDDINQGKNGTCGAASLESRMYTTNPAAAAKMVTDVTTKGFFDTPPPENVRVTPHKDSTFKASGNELKAPPPDPSTDDRTLASQIFQTTAVSIVKPGYEKREPTESNSTGEVIVTQQKFLGRGEETVKFTGLQNEDVRKMEQSIVGGDLTKTPIIDNANTKDKSAEVIKVKNEQEMHEQLQKLKGPPSQLPVVIAVQTQHPPFLQDSGAGLAGGSGAGHYVTITDYDPATRTATMDNQWGKSNDHSISARDLYIATTDPKEKGTIKEIEQAIKEAKKEGKDTTTLELDLLRTKHEMKPPLINDAQYAASLNKVMLDAEKNWQKSGKPADAGKIRLQYFSSLADLPNGPQTAEKLYGAQGKSMVQQIKNLRKPS